MRRFLFICEPIFNNRNVIKARALIIEKSPDPYAEDSKIVKDFELMLQVPNLKEYAFGSGKNNSRQKRT